MLSKIKRRFFLFICLFAGQNSKITKANSVGFAEQITQKFAFAILLGKKANEQFAQQILLFAQQIAQQIAGQIAQQISGPFFAEQI